MNSTDQQPQEDKTLWRSCLRFAVFFAVASLLMMAIVALAMWTLQPGEVSGGSVILRQVLWLLIGGGGLALIVYLYRWMTNDVEQRGDRSGEILQRTLPDLAIKQESEADEKPSLWQFFEQLILLSLFLMLFLILVRALRLAIGEGLKLIWTDVPGWIQEVVGLTMLIGSILIIGRFVNRRRKRREEPTTSLKEDVVRLARSLFSFLLNVLPVLWVTEKVSDLNLNPIFTIPVGIILATATFGLLNLAYIVIPDLWITAAVKRGNYDQALWRNQVAEKVSTSSSMYLCQHGLILWRAGRYAEAEQVLRTGIVETRRDGASGILMLNTLGYALIEQGKYEEAVKVFEGAIALNPNEGSLYDSLADAYLSQEVETEKALELLDHALTRYQPSWLKRRLRRRSVSATWAGRAWALARLARRTEAAESLEKAFALAPRKHNADFAEILYRAGHALVLLGETRKAAEHFAEAQSLDPHGHYGRLCAEAAARLRE